MTTREITSRRRLLRMLATSPLLAYSGLSTARALTNIAQDDGIITAPEQAVNVLEFEDVARKKLPPAHWGYLATGVDDDGTIRANRAGFERYQLRVRRLRDVQTLDLSVNLFGTKWETPIVIAPVGSQKAFHPEGEVAVAKAARARGHLQLLSTVASSSVETVNEARGMPVWYQLYPTNVWEVTRGLVKRAEAAGCPVLVLTVDLQAGSNRETLAQARRVDTRACADCHIGGFGVNATIRRRPMFQGLDVSKVTGTHPLNMTWDVIKRLRDTTSMKLLVKGLVTREDAELAVANGVDGIVVSNHGGRAEPSNRSTIECLPEIVAGVAGKIPVLIDGGFRRGTDIFKALALGANAILIGRPYIWGLAAFGQPGVETVLTLLRRELELVMRQAGTTSIAKITREYLVER